MKRESIKAPKSKKDGAPNKVQHTTKDKKDDNMYKKGRVKGY